MLGLNLEKEAPDLMKIFPDSLQPVAEMEGSYGNHTDQLVSLVSLAITYSYSLC